MSRARKPLTKDMILAAMAKTKSNRAASRYLNVSYIHYKGYAKMYIDKETGKSLFEKHKNQCGKGIPKFLKAKGKENLIPLADKNFYTYVKKEIKRD